MGRRRILGGCQAWRRRAGRDGPRASPRRTPGAARQLPRPPASTNATRRTESESVSSVEAPLRTVWNATCVSVSGARSDRPYGEGDSPRRETEQYRTPVLPLQCQSGGRGVGQQGSASAEYAQATTASLLHTPNVSACSGHSTGGTTSLRTRAVESRGGDA